jgi:CheY-like chemotaxis protein
MSFRSSTSLTTNTNSNAGKFAAVLANTRIVDDCRFFAQRESSRISRFYVDGSLAAMGPRTRSSGHRKGTMEQTIQKNRLKVFLIEDDESDIYLVQEILAQYASKSASNPFELINAGTLEEALERVGRESVDVILLDLTLPDSQGLETLRRLRSKSGDIPIVILSGVTDEEFSIEAVRNGAQDFLVKGQVEAMRLSRIIRYAVERKRSQSENGAKLDGTAKAPATKLSNGAGLSDQFSMPLLRTAFNACGDAFLLVAQGGVPLVCNVAFAKLWGFPETLASTNLHGLKGALQERIKNSDALRLAPEGFDGASFLELTDGRVVAYESVPTFERVPEGTGVLRFRACSPENRP